VGVFAGLGHPDLVQGRLDLGLHRLGQLLQYVGRLVHPAALVHRLRVEFGERLPEAQRTVADGQLRPLRQAALAIGERAAEDGHDVIDLERLEHVHAGP